MYIHSDTNSECHEINLLPVCFIFFWSFPNLESHEWRQMNEERIYIQYTCMKEIENDRRREKNLRMFFLSKPYWMYYIYLFINFFTLIQKHHIDDRGGWWWYFNKKKFNFRWFSATSREEWYMSMRLIKLNIIFLLLLLMCQHKNEEASNHKSKIQQVQLNRIDYLINHILAKNFCILYILICVTKFMHLTLCLSVYIFLCVCLFRTHTHTLNQKLIQAIYVSFRDYNICYCCNSNSIALLYCKNC